MDNSAWETVLIEWINCLKLSKVIRKIHDLRDGDFFVNLQRLTNKKQTCDVTVFKFLNKLLEEHYPNCTIKCRNEQQFRELPDKKLKTLTSLVLHYTCIYDRRDLLTSPLCHCLSQNTQLVIRNFLQTVEGNVSYNELDELINKCLQKRDLEKFSPWGYGNSVESSHSPLQDILKTPISKTGRLQEKDREISRLKSDLALETDEKNDLKVEVRVHCEKNKKLEFQLTQKNLEIQRLRTEVIDLENRTPPHFQDIDSRKIQNSLRSEIQSLELYIQQIETEQELMRNQEDQTKQKVRNLEIQNEELKTKLYDLEKQLDFSTSYNSEQDEKIMVLQSHCNELTTLLEELQSKPTETTIYDSFHHSTRRSIANYSSCENLATSVVEIQLQDCQKLNEELQDLLKQSENFGSDLKTELASLKTDLEVAHDESASIRKENVIMLLKITDLKEEVCTTKSDLLHCIEKLIEQETQASERNCKLLELQDELLNLKNQLQLANCSKEEISFNLDALKKINLELEEENSRCNEKLIEQETQTSERNCMLLELQDELLNLKNQLQLANCSKEEISFNLDALKKINLELEEENSRCNEKLIEQETQTSERNCMLLELQDELLNLKNQLQLANCSKEEISFNLDALKKINLELEEENSRCNEKLIEQETQTSERNCMLLELQDELLNLKNQLQLTNCSKEEISFNLDALKKINLELEEENSRCNEKLIEQETQTSERNCMLLELQDELLNLKNQLQLANCSKEEISFNLDALKKINLELEEENSRCNEKLIEQETQTSERNCMLLELQDELLNLKNQLQLTNCSKEEISFNLDALKKINLELEEENSRCNEKLIEQETQTSERNCMLLELQDELLNLKNQLQLANCSKEEISFNLDALKKINLELEEENSRCNEKLIEQETQTSERNCMLLELQDELLNLKNQLQLTNCSKEEISFNLDALKKINLELEEENSRCNEKLIEQETQTSERNCMLLELQDELLNLKNQLQLANCSKEEISFNLDALKKINLELEEENSRCNEKLIEQETQISEGNCKLLELQDELLNLKNQLQLANCSKEEISFNLDALKKINFELEEENSRCNEKLIEQESQTSERNCMLLELQDELLNLKNQLQLANCSKEEISFNLDALKKINLELEEENSRCNEKLIEQESQTSERNCMLLELQDELLNLKNQLQLANCSKEEISFNLNALKKINLELEEENSRCNEKLIEQETQISEGNCKLLELQDELLNLKNQLQLSNCSKEEISFNLNALKKINLELEEENSRCNEKLIEQETQISEGNCKLLELQDELLNLNNQLQLSNCSKEEISFNLDALKKINLELEEENSRCNEKLIEQETQISEGNCKLLELQDELLNLKNQLQLANCSKEEISFNLDALKKINLELEEENSRCNEKLIEQETQTSERNCKLLELQDEFLNLKNQLQLANCSKEEISFNLDALKKINLELEEENSRCIEKLIEQETQTSERNCKLLELQDELLNLKNQLQLANCSKEEISFNLDALKKINLEHEEENSRCNEKLIEQETQISEGNCKLLELQDELLNLKNQLQLSNCSKEEISFNLDALKKINLELEEENSRCNEKLIEQETQISEGNCKLLELQDELLNLKNQLQLSNCSKEEISFNLDALKKINLELEEENSRCNEKLIEQETQTSERNCKLLELQDELLNLKNQLQLANCSKEEISFNLDALKKINLELEEENSRCNEKLIEQETQISEGNCKLLELQDELLNLKNQLQLPNCSKEEISFNLDALKKINLELEEENSRCNEKLIEQETQISEGNCKLLELQDELLNLKNQLQLSNCSKEEISFNLDALKKINLELEEENSRCNEKLIEQETQTSERNCMLLELQDELLNLKNQLQLANCSKEEISFNLDALKKINLELEEENSRCNEKLIEQETQISEGNCKLLELQDELLNLKNQLQLSNCSKEEISFNLDALKKINLELEEENSRCNEKLIEQETQTSERNCMLLELQDELLNLKNQLQLANCSKEEISFNLDALKKINLELEEKNCKVERSGDALIVEKQQLEDKLNRLESKLSDTKEQQAMKIANYDEELARIEGHYEIILSEHKGTFDNLKLLNEKITADLNVSKTEIRSLQETIADLSTQKKQLERGLSNGESKIAKKSDQIASLKRELEELEDRHSECKSVIDDNVDVIDSLRFKNEKLLVDIDALNGDMLNMRKKRNVMLESQKRLIEETEANVSRAHSNAIDVKNDLLKRVEMAECDRNERKRELELKLRDAIEQKGELEMNYASLTVQLETIKDENARQLESIQMKLDFEHEEKTRLESRLVEMEAEYSKCCRDFEVERVRREGELKVEAAERYKHYESEIEDLMREKENWTAEKSETSSRTFLQEECNSLRVNNEYLKEKQTELQQKIDVLANSSESILNCYNSFKTSYGQFASKLNALISKKNVLDSLTSNLRMQLIAAQKNVNVEQGNFRQLLERKETYEIIAEDIFKYYNKYSKQIHEMLFETMQVYERSCDSIFANMDVKIEGIYEKYKVEDFVDQICDLTDRTMDVLEQLKVFNKDLANFNKAGHKPPKENILGSSNKLNLNVEKMKEDELKKKVLMLKQKLTLSENAKGNLEKKVKQLREENKNILQKPVTLDDDVHYKMLLQEHIACKEEHEQILRDCNLQYDKLKKEYDDLKTNVTPRVPKIELDEDNVKLQHDMGRLRQAYASVVSDNDKLMAENVKLKATVDEYKTEVTTFLSIKEAYDKLLEDNNKLMTDVDTIRYKRSRDRDEYIRLLKKEREEHQSKDSKRIQEVRGDYEAKLEKMKDKMIKLYRYEVNKEMNRVKAGQNENTSLLKVIEQLKGDLFESEQKIHLLETECEIIRSRRPQTYERNTLMDSISDRLSICSNGSLAAGPSIRDHVNTRRDTMNRMYPGSSATMDNRRQVYRQMDERRTSTLPRTGTVIEEITIARRTSIGIPNGMGSNIQMEDEDEMFNNKYLADLKEGKCALQSTDRESTMSRVSELAWRNSMVPPHLKSSYPAETQFCSPGHYKEEDIKVGNLGFDDSLSKLLPSDKQRKKDFGTTSYKKPGPPTPSKNGGRLSLQSNEVHPAKEPAESKTPKRLTPGRIKALFTGRNTSKSTSEVVASPKSRRLNIFRKPR